ncbi:probable sucrose-phosphate synthase isoform X1 [Chenopodium quinoa]|uniref:probable sucrose-phosphate synthase isoform X1 n=2 Tax=Chenopodium quinoa TaxID=63459 RepID=UPI000B77B22A|nr:probable sucrose-phosphate synthase isoform X1 [Chenopodium quinoa]
MAGNDWINSYLEAILDVGPGLDDAKSSLLLRERGRFSPTRYFVEEVITGFDETDLHRSWARAQATRSPQERNTRLENMCWRIWNLARQKKQLENEEAQRKAKRRMELERGRREATAEMSEDLSEGEKDVSAHGESNRPRLPRINSLDAMETWISQQKGKKLYLVLISLHGLIRGENMELGRDSDTGGQVKYVVELARALGSMPGVYRVDLLTRQVSSPDVDWSYGEPTEMLNRTDSNGFDDDNDDDEMGESSGAYIVRIPFGPRDKYIPKEELWPYIPEFVDGALNHIVQMSKVLGEQIGGGETVWPVAIHGHYADAGDSAALLSGALNVPMLLTGHSLGRDKLEQLLKQGRMSKEDINNTYKMMRRIEAEELSLDASEIVITSTRQEIEEQWRLYDGFDPVLERKLRARMKRGVSCYGRFMPRMVVIPPGMEFHHIVPHEVDLDGEAEEIEEHPTSPPPIWTEIMRFFTNPRKPMILALARPDPKKNITTLVKAFGECRPLRELANLTLIMGNRDGIDEMSSTSSSVLMSVLKLIDKYDLYGQVAYPKHHNQADVPEIYRLAAKTKGVFINPAFIEPFGLTLIEAAAHGLPMVATKNGGPVDIQRVLDNGLLVDPHEQQSLATALLKLVADKQLWAKCRQNGLKNIHLYSWPEHCKTYLSRIASCRQRQPQWQKPSDEGIENEETESPSDSLRDIKDISLNLKFSISLDGDKGEDVESLGNDGKNNLENAVMSWSKGDPKDARKARFSDKGDLASSKYPAFRRRKHIYVIAVDGDYEDGLSDIIRRIFDAADKDKTEGSIGFILSTSYSMPEIQSYLLSKGFNLNDFDAYICNSGSDLYYSSLTPEESPIVADSDYHSHIEYRWGGEGLRRTLLRWAASIAVKKDDNEEQVVTEDNEVSTDYCFAFKIKNQDKVPPSKELRKSMRIQGLRCHVIYCQNGTKMNVIPVLASRSQALRYLYVRWGVDLSKMVVFVGECGDTDYEGLLGGVHKSVIMKGVSNKAFKSLHANRNYPLTHVVSLDSPNIGEVGEGCSSSEIQSIVTKLGNSKA